MTNNPQSLHQSVTSEDKKSTTSFYTLVGFIIAVVVAAAFVVLSVYLSKFNGELGNQELFGQFGDYLGGVLNPILGFATVVLLVVSLKLQMNELALARKEMMAANVEASLSREAMQAQVAHLDKEAKLNELNRIMVDLRTQFKSFTSTKLFDDPSLYKAIFSNRAPMTAAKQKYLQEQTMHFFLYGLSADAVKHHDNAKIELMNQYKESLKTSNHRQWLELEYLLILFSNLTIRYFSESITPELSLFYLHETKGMLQPFQDIFWTDKIAEQIGKIDNLLYLASENQIN